MASEIQSRVAQHFKISVTDLVGTTRSPIVVIARHLAWYLEREKGLSYPAIGKLYEREHTTILIACKHVTERLAAGDARYKLPLEALRTKADYEQQKKDDHATTCPTCGTSVMELHRQILFIHKRLSELGVKL